MQLQDIVNLLKGQQLIDPTQSTGYNASGPVMNWNGKQVSGPLPTPQVVQNIPQTTPTGPIQSQVTPQATPQVLQAAQGLNQQATPTTQSMIPGYTNGKVPAQYGNMVLSAASKYGLHPAVLAGIVQTENGGWSPGVKDNANIDPDTGEILSVDRGFMQINNKAHPDVTDQQARDPQFAIDYAARLLSGYIKNAGDVNRGIAAYNVGEGGAATQGVNAFGGGPKGQKYLDAVAKNIDPNVAKQLGLKIGDPIWFDRQGNPIPTSKDKKGNPIYNK